MKIYHFYHIWADGMWEEPLSYHINALRESQLEQVISKFFIGLVGSKENRERVLLYLKSIGVGYIVVDESDTGYEEVTLNKILDMDLEDGYLLYAHTKGSFHNHYENIILRKNMTKSLVLDWINCVDLLEDYACVGYLYYILKDQNKENMDGANRLPIDEYMCSSKSKVESKGKFLGNFWWANLRYIKKLPRIPMLNSENRHEAEIWIYGLKDVVKDIPFKVFTRKPLFERSRYE
jgi:hypothetical protein